MASALVYGSWQGPTDFLEPCYAIPWEPSSGEISEANPRQFKPLGESEYRIDLHPTNSNQHRIFARDGSGNYNVVTVVNSNDALAMWFRQYARVGYQVEVAGNVGNLEFRNGGAGTGRVFWPNNEMIAGCAVVSMYPPGSANQGRITSIGWTASTDNPGPSGIPTVPVQHMGLKDMLLESQAGLGTLQGEPALTLPQQNWANMNSYTSPHTGLWTLYGCRVMPDRLAQDKAFSMVPSSSTWHGSVPQGGFGHKFGMRGYRMRWDIRNCTFSPTGEHILYNDGNNPVKLGGDWNSGCFWINNTHEAATPWGTIKGDSGDGGDGRNPVQITNRFLSGPGGEAGGDSGRGPMLFASSDFRCAWDDVGIKFYGHQGPVTVRDCTVYSRRGMALSCEQWWYARTHLDAEGFSMPSITVKGLTSYQANGEKNATMGFVMVKDIYVHMDWISNGNNKPSIALDSEWQIADGGQSPYWNGSFPQSGSTGQWQNYPGHQTLHLIRASGGPANVSEYSGWSTNKKILFADRQSTTGKEYEPTNAQINALGEDEGTGGDVLLSANIAVPLIVSASLRVPAEIACSVTLPLSVSASLSLSSRPPPPPPPSGGEPTSMGLATSFYVGDGTTTAFTIHWPSLEASHILATVDGTAVTAFNINTHRTQLVFTVPPADGAAIKIHRSTPLTPLVDFAAGPLRSGDLDRAFLQTLYIAQEQRDIFDILGAP